MGNSFRNTAVALIALGALMKTPPVTVFGAFLLGVVALSWIASRLALGEVTYTRKLSATVAFPGDSVDLTVTVENKKPLPIPLVCDDEVPRDWEIAPKSARGHYTRPGRAQLRNQMGLGGFETVTRRFAVVCDTRGVFPVGPAKLSSSDPFGLYPVSAQVERVDHLTVYPRVIPVEDPPGQNLYPFGSSRAPSWTYQDPNVLKMVREYVPGDAARHMDWKATARSGNLQSRVFDAALGKRVVICLDVSTSRTPWEGTDRDAFESLVVAASSLCAHFHAKGFAVGLASNGVARTSEGICLAQCPPAAGDGHLARILSLMAGLDHYAYATAASACSRPWVASAGSFPVVLTSLADDEALSLVKRLRRISPVVALVALCLRGGWQRESELKMRTAAKIPGVHAINGFLEGGWDRAAAFTLSCVE